ncbi:hypothetical protein WJ968_06135 [Achromobacter xylosoxidans]
MAGAVGVKLAMESNNVKVNIQGNEQRDAPVSRDGKTLNNTDVWVDRRTLIQIAKGVNGYERERWYTPGGLLEVGGYLGTTEHGVGEWAAVGGIVTVAGGELVSRAGSQINISGGTLDVQSGYLRQSWLRGEDGTGCTKYRVRREICCTRACTRASRMSMRVGATRARAISTTR